MHSQEPDTEQNNINSSQCLCAAVTPHQSFSNMQTLRKSDVPKYLRRSPCYQSLSDDYGDTFEISSECFHQQHFLINLSEIVKLNRCEDSRITNYSCQSVQIQNCGAHCKQHRCDSCIVHHDFAIYLQIKTF